MRLDNDNYGMSDHSDLVTPPDCVGVVFGGSTSGGTMSRVRS